MFISTNLLTVENVLLAMILDLISAKSVSTFAVVKLLSCRVLSFKDVFYKGVWARTKSPLQTAFLQIAGVIT